jgi:hypothetical protein
LKIVINLPPQRFADLLCSFVEGNDPVSQWCTDVALKSSVGATPGIDRHWYAEGKTFEGTFVFQVTELVDERSGELKEHLISQDDVLKGFEKIAANEDYAHHFGNLLSDNEDAATADIIMQFIVFGEEKYA